jgi:hypothetical protein
VVGTPLDAQRITDEMRRATPELSDALRKAPRPPTTAPTLPGVPVPLPTPPPTSSAPAPEPRLQVAPAPPTPVPAPPPAGVPPIPPAPPQPPPR